MNLAYIDIDAIFWKAFNNLRLFNVESFIRKIYEETNSDKIYVLADFSTKEYLKPLSKTLTELQNKYPIEMVDGYSKLEERNLTDISLINMIYQKVIEQERPDENVFTLATSSAKYFPMINFIQKTTNVKFNLFISNDVPFFDKLNEKYQIAGIIDLDKDKKTTFDKITINEIMKSVLWGEENGRWKTIKQVIEDCKKISKISEDKTEFMIHALISQEYLVKKMLNNTKDNIQYKIIVYGEKEKVNKLLTIINA